MSAQHRPGASHPAAPGAMSATEARDHLIEALRDAQAAVRTHTGHRPTMNHIQAVLDAEPAIPALREELREASRFLFIEAGRPATTAIAAISTALRVTRQRLTCPDCGGPITATTSRGFRGDEHVDGYECHDTDCWAAWDADGASTSLDPA